MIVILNSYPVYRDSGVEWLGKVPEHWEVRRLGTLMQERGEQNEHGDITEVLSVMRDRGVIPYSEKGNIGNKKSDDITRYKIVLPNDIVVNSMNVIIGSVGLSRYTGCLSPVYYVLTTRSKRDRPAYFGYCFRCRMFQRSLVRLGNGILAHRMRIPWDLLKCEIIGVPSSAEQTAIVRYLDHVNTRIRRYIEAKEKLLRLLEEQKRAVIHEAVTGRIDVHTGRPYPAYKDSGVEWLGKVPEHWVAVPLKRVGWFCSGAGFPISSQGNSQDAILFVKVSDMNRKGNAREIVTAENSVSREVARTLRAHIFPPQAIIFPKVGGALLTNKRRVLVHETCIDNNLMGCVVTNAETGFVLRVFQRLDLGQMAKPGPVPAIGEGEVRDVRVPLPPRPEQNAIACYLDEATATIERTIELTRRQIALAEEYRTGLISDVVTGKLDVREAAANLPETDPLATNLDRAETGPTESNLHSTEHDMAQQAIP